MRGFWSSWLLLALALSAQAGVLEDLKSSATGMRDTIQDVKSTKDEAKGVATDAKDLADDSAKDVNSALPKTETPPPPSAQTPPPPPSAVSAPPPPPSATPWSIDIGNGQTKTVAQSELKGLIQSGQV